MIDDPKRELRLDLSTVVGATGDERVSAHVPGSRHEILNLAFMRRIYLQAWPTGSRAFWNLGEWRHYLEETRSYVYLTAHGFVEFHHDNGDSFFVELLAVDRQHRHKGHGRALMHMVIKHGLALMKRRIILVTTPDVQPFYTRLGFEFYREVEYDPTPVPPPAAA